ncbi:hypothetical protein Dimus_001318 [Dionaea muscipula]
MLVHIDAVKEFYAKMTVIHLKKKDVVKSSVKGISIEFDHERLAVILDVLGRTGICEYIKEVWEESRYTKPLDITRRVANDETITAARRVKSMVKKGEEPKRYDYFEETFLTMCKLTRENGIWWIGSGENRRRDDDVNAPEEEAEEEEERNKDDFDWEAVIDEATVEGESGSDDQFYDAQIEVEEPVTETPATQVMHGFISSSTEGTRHLQSRPSCPIGGLRKLNLRNSKQSLKEKGQTDFMMIWRRPKLRMPDF